MIIPSPSFSIKIRPLSKYRENKSSVQNKLQSQAAV